MSGFVDYTTPKHTFDVSTTVTRNGQSYMGPTIRVNANDSWHAREVAMSLGHEPNHYFPPEQVK